MSGTSQHEGPDLAEGETLLHQHTPDLGAFKRTALLLLAITLVPTVVMYVAFPDTFWVAVPLFISCFLLMQERFGLGKHAAWVTDRRIIWQDGRTIDLAEINTVDMIGNAVRIRTKDHGTKHKLYYAKGRRALRDLVNSARGDAT